MRDARSDFFPYIATADGQLYDLSYKLMPYKGKTKNDHIHCELCWITISKGELNGDKAKGYYCKDTGCWLCKKCFSDFASKFRWHIIEEAN